MPGVSLEALKLPLCSVTATSPIHMGRQSGTLNPNINPTPANSALAGETEFFMELKQSISDGIRDSMGPQILGMLQDKGFLENPGEASQFHRQLSILFGNGTSVLEKIIIKELYRRLNIAYDSSSGFDYGKALLRAKEICILEGYPR